MVKSLKAMGPVVAVSLLLVVAVVAVTSFQGWFGTFSSEVFGDVETRSDDSISTTGIDTLVEEDLFFINSRLENLSVSMVVYGGYDCGYSGNVTNGMNTIPLIDCVDNVTEAKNELVVYTDQRVYSKYFLNRNYAVGAGGLGGGSVTTGNTTVSFDIASTCTNVSFTKVYGYNFTNNSHVQIPTLNTYSRSLCVYNEDYPVGTSCSGVYDRVFYLADTTEAHLYLDNSSAYGGPHNWQEICVSAGGAASLVNVTYSTLDLSLQNFSCIGSYDNTNVNLYGTMLGECSQNVDKIWIKIE